MSYSNLSMLSSLLVLLLLDRTQANSERTNTKRDVSDSFDINIGAGYGVGVGQPSALLPKSTTTVTHSTNNHLHQILEDEAMFRQPRVMVDNFRPNQVDTIQDNSFAPAEFQPQESMQDIVTGRPQTTDLWRDDFERKPLRARNPMNMKEIQNVLHNLDDDSEYSKIVQVVKVPAIYEIHLEKSQKLNRMKSGNYGHKTNVGNGNDQNRYAQKPHTHDHVFPKHMINPVLKHHFTHREVGASTAAMNKNQPPPAHYSRPKLVPHHPQVYFENTRHKKNTNSLARPNFQPPMGQNFEQFQPTHGMFPAQLKTLGSFSTLAPLIPFDVKQAPATINFQNVHRSLGTPPSERFTHHPGMKEEYIYGRQIERVSSPDEINITVQPGNTMVTFPREEGFIERRFSESGGRDCDTNGELHSRADDVYITTNRPVHPPRIARRLFSGSRGDDPVKYYIFINKKYHDEEDR